MKRAAYPSVLLLTLVLAACGGSGSDETVPASASTASTEVSAEAATDSAPEEAAADSSPADIPAAVAEAEDADDLALAQSPLNVPEEDAETLPDEEMSPEVLAEQSTSPTPETNSDQVATAATTTSLYHLYVATTGSDSNPGTQTRPFKTILKASAVAKPGTTVHVAPGNYPGGISTSKSGTASARIIYQSDVKWGAKIVPAVNSTRDVAWRNSGKYVDIVGFDVNGSNYQGGTKWRIGLSTSGDRSVIRSNRVRYLAQDQCTPGVGGAGISTGSAFWGARTDVLDNIVHDVGPKYVSETQKCLYIQGIYFQTEGSVKNNVAYNNGYAGIALSHDVYNADVVNNTAVNNGTGIHMNGSGFYRNPYQKIDYMNISNNLLANNKRYAIRVVLNVGTHNTYTNNLSYNNALGSLSGRITTSSGTIVANPQFVNLAANDFRLKSTSPAINKGLSTYAPPTDILGVARPQGGRDDIGAYEFVQ